jgi:hypothetical protein
MGWAVRCREHTLDIANEVFFIIHASFDSKKTMQAAYIVCVSKIVD